MCLQQVLGTDELIQYVDKYDLNFNTSIITSRLPRIPWGELVDHNNKESEEFATADAIDLLQRLLV